MAPAGARATREPSASDKARVACTRLQIDEQALAQALVQLRDQLAPFTR